MKSLNVPVICFPREIKNYKEFCEIVKPDALNIDYNVEASDGEYTVISDDGEFVFDNTCNLSFNINCNYFASKK